MEPSAWRQTSNWSSPVWTDCVYCECWELLFHRGPNTIQTHLIIPLLAGEDLPLRRQFRSYSLRCRQPLVCSIEIKYHSEGKSWAWLKKTKVSLAVLWLRFCSYCFLAGQLPYVWQKLCPLVNVPNFSPLLQPAYAAFEVFFFFCLITFWLNLDSQLLEVVLPGVHLIPLNFQGRFQICVNWWPVMINSCCLFYFH